jgi:nucleotide sugar dehydrogenase
MRRVSVIGFGKIGQAVAANMLHAGLMITAVDRNNAILESFEEGTYETNEPQLHERLTSAYAQQQLKITNDFAEVKGSDGVIIAIPLLINEEKEILHEPFAACLRELAPYLDNNTIVVIETSIPVGYGRGHVVPTIESTGKIHGEDFLLAYSPERIKSGTMLEQLQLIPKVIGGVTHEAAEKAFQLYRQFFAEDLVHVVESIEAAEMVKLAGMIYRDINIALANQLAQFANASGINFADLIPLINTDREANLLQPGIGVGGHCTPVYPYFLMDNFREVGLEFTLAQQGRRINNSMALHALSLVRDKIETKHALILGLAFRPNVKEDTLSTTYHLHEILLKEGYSVWVHDEEYSAEELAMKGFRAVKSVYEKKVEVVFLVTMHNEYNELDFTKLGENGIRFFVDGRNSVSRTKVESAGIEYFGIGR